MEKYKIITVEERNARKIAKAKNGENILPSNWEMLKNIVQAAKEAIESGLDVRGPEETEKALKICDTCPHLINDGASFRCGKCGCHLKYKTSLTAWHCPIGKW